MVDSHKMSNHFKSNKINVDNIRNYLTEFEKNHENSGDKYPLKSLDFYDFFIFTIHILSLEHISILNFIALKTTEI